MTMDAVLNLNPTWSTDMAKKQYHIVWNKRKTEGYITDDENDATYAQSGIQISVSAGMSTLAEALRESYAYDDGDDNGIELPAQTVILEV
jgi:hypothetical protein